MSSGITDRPPNPRTWTCITVLKLGAVAHRSLNASSFQSMFRPEEVVGRGGDGTGAQGDKVRRILTLSGPVSWHWCSYSFSPETCTCCCTLLLLLEKLHGPGDVNLFLSEDDAQQSGWTFSALYNVYST